MKNITKIKELWIEEFRGLKNISIPLGDRVTLICGKNGTSKSTILGILAQVLNFEKDYVNDEALDFRTLTDTRFKSDFSEHFRLSEKFDKPDSMSAKVHLYDGYSENSTWLTLKLYSSADRAKPRPIVRDNTLDGDAKSRNATHPVIYLSLKRLTPISQRQKYSKHSLEYLSAHQKSFVADSNRLLSKPQGTSATATAGSIKSAAVHGDFYDHESVSAGEDNAGQILLALYSFRMLKEKYPNYKGGLLLIDEADAGLFPAAQLELIKILTETCKSLNLQVVMTSHSPTMIEELFSLNRLDPNNYRNIYLSDSYGGIEVYDNFSWPQIYADLHVKTVDLDTARIPKVNVYFEDQEACDFFNALLTEQKIRKVLNQVKKVSLGCKQYVALAQSRIDEFSTKSIIVLDGDVADTSKISNIITLPTALSPDQLIFEFLYNLDPGAPYWKNRLSFTKPVFLKIANKICQTLNIAGEGKLDLASAIQQYRKSPSFNDAKLRDHFKTFAEDQAVLKMINGGVALNPYRAWAKANPELVDAFNCDFKSRLVSTLKKGYGIDTALLGPLLPEPARLAKPADK